MMCRSSRKCSMAVATTMGRVGGSMLSIMQADIVSICCVLLLVISAVPHSIARTFDESPPSPMHNGQHPTYTVAPSTTTTTATTGTADPADAAAAATAAIDTNTTYIITTTPIPNAILESPQSSAVPNGLNYPSTDSPDLINTDATTTDDSAAAAASIGPPACFYADPELCAEPRPETAACRECFAHPTEPNTLVCCNVTGDIQSAIACVPHPAQPADNSSHYWINLHVHNATVDELDFSQKYWKRLDSLVVTDGHVRRIVKEFSKFSSPKCINVSNNELQVIHSRAFKELTRLQVLDLSHNNLSSMPNVNSLQANLSLDVSGNKEMLCKSILETMERDGVHFLNLDETNCLTNQTFTWFNSTDSVSLFELVQQRQLQSECPTIPGHGSCKCGSERMTYEHSSRHFRIMAQVDCSNMGLTALPEKLPENTLFLNVTGNNITSLMAFNNPSYEQILKLEADDNQIHSLLDLEGTKFLQNFIIMRLRRNSIRTIPMYMLSNTLDRSPDGRAVNLGGNQLHCDCNSAKVLKLWLIARQIHITDSDRIECVNLPGQLVMGLSEIRLCQSPQDWTDYIYCLIALEIVLLVALVCKVSYDYWVFKTAGYLPWPASKMPKLPCDWLCES